jgi:hypothetical protein
LDGFGHLHAARAAARRGQRRPDFVDRDGAGRRPAPASTGRYKRFPVAGLVLMTAGLVALAPATGDPSRTTTSGATA